MKKVYYHFTLFKKKFTRLGLVTLMLLLVSMLSWGQVQWTNAGASTAWYTATNWTPNTGSGAWLTTDVAQFNNTGTAITSGINMGTASLSIAAVEVTSLRSRVLTIGNSSATLGTLTLNGGTVNAISNVVLRNASGFLFTLQDNETGTGKTMNIALANNTDNIINIDGAAGITISSVISGAGKNLTLSGAGSGTLSLTGADTYDGLTTVSSNTLQLNKTGGGTLPATNNVLINGTGNLRISTPQTLNNLTLATGGTLTVDNGITLTINGTFNHNGGTITLTGTGSIVYGAGATLSYGASTLQTTTSAEFPAASGPANLIINNAAGVVLHSARTVSSTLTLTDGNFTLGANDFTASIVSAAPTATNKHVVTNSSGELIITNINAVPILFPIGASTTTINPLIIFNGQNINYGARVAIGINPAIAYSNIAVNRTWVVKAATATPSLPVNVNFFYSAGDGNAGFDYLATVDVGLYTTLWNIAQTGLVQAGSYQVASTISSFGLNIDAPLVIGNLGAILATRQLIGLNAQRQNSMAHLSWAAIGTDARQLEIERSANGRNFIFLAAVDITATFYNDDKLLPGINYYRLKLTDVNGKVTYSSMASVLNKATGFDIVGLSPTVVTSNAVLNVTAAQKTKIDVLITDVTGRLVQKMVYNLIAGSNQFNLNLSNLSAGTYQIAGYTAEGRSTTVRFVKQ